MSARKTIQEMHKLAAAKGGECLSGAYVNNHTKLRWRCAKGHEWNTKPIKIQQGRWCPVCAGNQLRTIEDMRRPAATHGGECLSAAYVNNHTELRWKCAEGHEFGMIPANVRRGQWCPKCSHGRAGKSQRLTMQEMRELAAALGGECLSDAYVDKDTKLRWRCAEGHEWEATPGNVKCGTWCRKCSNKRAGEDRRLTLKDMQEIAASRNGRCLSEVYVNAFAKLRWECSEGHRWEAKPNGVQQGYWCPYCKNRSERICRGICEALFQEKFPKARPDWLVGYHGRKLELDCYCVRLNLAFEYQGKQHDEEIPYFHRNGRTLGKQKQRDTLKVRLCLEHGIEPIQVPERVGYDGIEGFIRDEARKRGILVPRKNRVDWESLPGVYDAGCLKRMQEMAAAHGGECLSKVYIDALTTKLRWSCAEGHEFEMIPASVQQGRWCRACYLAHAGESRRLTIQEMRELAAAHGGECLSEAYVNTNTDLRWRCSKGHEFKAKPINVKYSGRWCPVCGGSQRKTIQDMQRLAAARGGECLSEAYVNSKTKLRWRCSEGHEFEMKPNSVQQDRWCPICGHKNAASL